MEPSVLTDAGLPTPNMRDDDRESGARDRAAAHPTWRLDPSATALALAPMHELWQILLATHVPDRDGRCVTCRWQTRAADRWPCDIYAIAAAAQRVAGKPDGLGR